MCCPNGKRNREGSPDPDDRTGDASRLASEETIDAEYLAAEKLLAQATPARFRI